MAIEVCVDIANHVIADRKLRIPTTYARRLKFWARLGSWTQRRRVP